LRYDRINITTLKGVFHANSKLNCPYSTLLVVTTMSAMRYETKLWMVNEKGEAVFGNGLAKLLEEIDNHDSILEAAEHLDMSYRYALHRLTLAEERLGEALVKRTRGGAKGGGSSEVTDFGKALVKRYRNAQAELRQMLEKMP
jgi:molybdate transport system regulatory protein